MKKYGYDMPVGKIWIGEDNGKIVYIKFSDTNGENIETPLIHKTYLQLKEYFEGKRKFFDIPLQIHGTPFQIKVWEALRRISYGQVVSYKDIACEIGNPKAARAVGMANNKNKIIILVPCHRVIGSNGSLTGYAEGLDVKKYLLELEARYSK